MSELVLLGCRNDSLLGYLKALGVLRVVSEQSDSAARGSWHGAAFVLHSRLGESELSSFFVDNYAPTPVVNPWNNGAGFDGEQNRKNGKTDRATGVLQAILATTAVRWAAYRSVVRFIVTQFVETGVRERLMNDGNKKDFIRELRARVPEEGLPWIDAAVGVTADDVAYPFLLGGGGNDGRLDFAVNFAERALEIVGPTASKTSRSLFLDSVFDSAAGDLVAGAAIGQFSPRHAGGVNASTGFASDSLINPWDYVLMMEGTLCYRGSLVRRLGSGRSRSAFPFSFHAVSGGYGSASTAEETRGELWLPVWDGRIGSAGINDLFRRGRVDMPGDEKSPMVRAAAVATEAASAALTAGAALGVRGFKRVAFVQRNGLAFTASVCGEVRVGEGSAPIVSSITRTTADWIGRIRSSKSLRGGEVGERLRVFDDCLFALASVGRPSRRRERELLTAIAYLDFAVARVSPEFPGPVPFLPSSVIDILDDGSVLHRVAAALASIGAEGVEKRLRLDFEHARYDAEKKRLHYARLRSPLAVQKLEATLSELSARRYRLAHSDSDENWLRGSYKLGTADVAVFLETGWDHESLKDLADLLVGYSIVNPARNSGISGPDSSAPTVPASFAVMKVVMDHPRARDVRISRYLNVDDARRALRLAYQRARTISALPFPVRNVVDAEIDRTRWYSAALLLPISRDPLNYRDLLGAALITKPSLEQVKQYLSTFSQT